MGLSDPKLSVLPILFFFRNLKKGKEKVMFRIWSIENHLSAHNLEEKTDLHYYSHKFFKY
jgi:hypothetical protein